MQIILSDSDSIISPDVHDGYLTGILFHENHKIQLEITTVQKQNLSLFLYEVHQLNIQNFNQISIILDIVVCQITDPSERYVINEIKKIYPNSNDEFIRNKLHELINDNMILVSISPSLGAEISLLCKKIEIQKSKINL